jgi:hypothetical protein
MSRGDVARADATSDENVPLVEDSYRCVSS